MTTTTAAPPLAGTNAIRFITAELLADLDRLAITPRSLSVDLYQDGLPARAQVWFESYADMQTFADLRGIGDRVNCNQSWESGLLHMGRNEWEPDSPFIAGVRTGLRLVSDRPETTNA